MSTIDLPDDVAAALAEAAAGRGMTEAELIAEMVTPPEPDALDALIGAGASGRVEPLDIHAERSAVAARHNATTI